MDKLRKIGLTALAGTFAATSAQALEMSVSGSAGFTFATADNDETTGNRFSFGDSLTFSGSGETDQGWTVSVSIEADGASANNYYDDRSLTVDMGDAGALSLKQSGAVGTPASQTSSAYGSVSHSLIAAAGAGVHTADGLGSGTDGETNVGYTNTIAGVSVGIGYTAGITGGSDHTIALSYSDLMDGLTVSYGMSDLNSAQASGTEETQISAKYAMGGITVAWHDMSADDEAAGGTDYDGRAWSVSFAVNDDLTVSYDTSTSDKSGTAVDEEVTSIQASYTMGSMTVKGHVSKADNSAFVSGSEDNAKAVAISWSF
tara:strand:+ start:15019 stop:15966 length:948 start_codon:yes stop_codon:yes gene_type:complete